MECIHCGGQFAGAEYSEETESCVYCYADGIGHGCEATCKADARLWIGEMYPHITEEQLSRAMGAFLAYRHTANLPENKHDDRELLFMAEILPPVNGFFRAIDPETGTRWCVSNASEDDVGCTLELRAWSADQFAEIIA